MNKDDCRSQMLEMLDAQNTSIAHANDYLVGIKDAIAENKLDELNQFLATPQLPIEDIDQLEQQRHRLLQDSGFSSDSSGFKKCVDWCDNSEGQVSEAYQQLIDGLVQLQHSIQLNSLLTRKGQDRLKRSIGILTGQPASTQCKTYSSKGQNLQNSGQRNIAVA
jgi:flagellar biosynthesis/type III secretory pathway chaperone